MNKILHIFFLIVILSFTLSLTAFASESTPQKNALQIISDVNKEFNMNFYIPSGQSTATVDIDGKIVDYNLINSLTPSELKEFESELRNAAKFLSNQRAISEKNWNNALVLSITGHQPVSTASSIPLPRHLSQDVTGAKIFFEGRVSDSVGFWRWTSLTNTYVRKDDYNPKYQFTCSPGNYTYTLLDASRTYAVKYNGTMFTKTLGIWFPSDHTQYCEWYAGKPK